MNKKNYRALVLSFLLFFTSCSLVGEWWYERLDKIILKVFPPLKLLCWNVVIFGRNLTDEQYEVPTLLGGSFTTGPLFSMSNAGKRPRAFGIEFGYEF